MKLLVFAHRLEIGGTQNNAIELAAELSRRHGHDVIVHAAPGPMQERIEDAGLRHVPAPDVRFHPSPSRIATLRALVRREKPDIIHAWDWWQGLEAYAGVHLPWGVPLLISDMMMTLTRVLPREVPTTFGLPETRDAAAQAGWRRPELLLPPVDARFNVPGAAEGGPFRARLGIGPDEILAVSVSRLSRQMKSEPLERAIATLARIGADGPMTLAIVGDGDARLRLEQLADRTNAVLGRRAVVFAGSMMDPRSAYAAADFVLGMGGSALRGLAFAKPLIVMGENGYARLFTQSTAPEFLQGGFYGRGEGGDVELAAALRTVAASAESRDASGRLGRDFVLRHFAIEALADDLAGLLGNVAREERQLSRAIRGLPRLGYVYLRDRRFATASRDIDPKTACAGSHLASATKRRQSDVPQGQSAS